MWIIQSPDEEIKNASVYFEKLEDNDAWFTSDRNRAKKFQDKEEARKLINDNALEKCHILPT